MSMLRVFTAFSGYDSQCMALDQIGVDYDLVGWSEIDKNAIEAHDRVFPQYKDRNLGDICKIDWARVPDFDLFTYSSPCQDFSRAGNMVGGVEHSGTRSSLLWECRKAILEKKPKYLILENVSDLVSNKFFPLFQKWVSDLEQMGYENHWRVLNASDFNIPQNRRRVFLVSIRKFAFPESISLENTIDKVLEPSVDDRYYINPDNVDCILKDQPGGDFLLVRQATKKGYIEVRIGGVFDSTFPKSKTRRGRVQGDGGNISPTLTASAGDCILRFEGWGKGKPIIRRLTEREQFRLMGVKDSDIDLIQESGMGARKQTHLAGNSIVVNVLAGVFRNLLT